MIKDSFDAEKVKNDIVVWIRKFFEQNGSDCKAVVAISGGKDSSVVAALCAEAVGPYRVFGVLMPKGEQKDIDAAMLLIETLRIPYTIINIGKSCDVLSNEISDRLGTSLSKQTETNLPARVRMTTAYAVSQTVNGRVANTGNLSENWVGYSTRYGDDVGDFSPLANLTVHEVKAVGRALDLPPSLVDKAPVDGLTPYTDEENLGFTYEVLDKYIRTGICDDKEIQKNIDERHRRNLFKLKLMPSFEYEGSIKAKA